MKAQPSREAVADLLERFLDLRLGPWEWDDFVGVRQNDPQLEDVRKTCLRARQEFPAGASGSWCDPEGLEEIRSALQKLRKNV